MNHKTCYNLVKLWGRKVMIWNKIHDGERCCTSRPCTVRLKVYQCRPDYFKRWKAAEKKSLMFPSNIGKAIKDFISSTEFTCTKLCSDILYVKSV